MREHELIITPIENIPLIDTAKTFSKTGMLFLSSDNLLYLSIDDKFIKKLCPLINEDNVVEPDYFSIGMGAHISVIYPNEYQSPKYELDKAFEFEVNNLLRAETKNAIYYVLSIYSPELMEIRYQNNLSERLNLNGYKVDMHCTIGKIFKTSC